jgi:hypothetical protein
MGTIRVLDDIPAIVATDSAFNARNPREIGRSSVLVSLWCEMEGPLARSTFPATRSHMTSLDWYFQGYVGRACTLEAPPFGSTRVSLLINILLHNVGGAYTARRLSNRRGFDFPKFRCGPHLPNPHGTLDAIHRAFLNIIDMRATMPLFQYPSSSSQSPQLPP